MRELLFSFPLSYYIIDSTKKPQTNAHLKVALQELATACVRCIGLRLGVEAGKHARGGRFRGVCTPRGGDAHGDLFWLAKLDTFRSLHYDLGAECETSHLPSTSKPKGGLFEKIKQAHQASPQHIARKERFLNRPSQQLNRLLMMGVVSRRFRKMLLSNPAKALEKGYHNEKVDLTPIERQLVFSINATTIEEFAQQLIQLVEELDAQQSE